MAKIAYAKMKSSKRKGRSPHTPNEQTIVCGDVVYLDENAITMIKRIFKN